MRKIVQIRDYQGGGSNMKKSISIYDVADTFLSFEVMTHKKLQKLCYYAQAIFIAISYEPLFDEHFEAWVHGPVSPDLYQKYKGAYIINNHDEVPIVIQKNHDVYDFLRAIYRAYGTYTGDELEIKTHQEYPWIKARMGLRKNENSSNIISIEDMGNYYRNMFT